MKLKKIPKYLAIVLLAAGASLILGVLSFSGMFALWSLLTLASASLILSVAYNGEVIWKNVNKALQKLLKPDYIKRQLAISYLRAHFPKAGTQGRAQFFTDYEEKVMRLHDFDHKKLNKADRAEKKRLEKELNVMRKWFSQQLFPSPNESEVSPYAKQVRDWLAKLAKQEAVDWPTLLKNRHQAFQRAALPSALAAVLMSLGTTYLLAEAFAIIPFTATLSVATLPILIVPMSLIAGVAYGYLTYNACTDMITNRTLQVWYERFKHDVTKNRQDWTVPQVLLTTTAFVLFALTIPVALCTAGTWWTIARQTPPLFHWMGNMPRFIMGILNPIVTSVTSLIFNIENTSESLEMLYEANQHTLHVLTPLQTPKDGIFDAIYRNTYVLQQFSKDLFYINHRGDAEPVPITNKTLFKQELEEIMQGRKTQRLTSEQYHRLITLNGGHTPKGEFFSRLFQSTKDIFDAWQAIENPWHRWNPFRLLLNITEPPTHKLFFLGHLASEGVNFNRVPSVSEASASLTGMACDGAKDAHYFFPHKPRHDDSLEALVDASLSDESGHNHNKDLPSRLLKYAFLPIRLLAEAWDELTDRHDGFQLSRIWEKAFDDEPLPNHTPHVAPNLFVPSSSQPALKYGWPMEHAVYRIERYKQKNLNNAWNDSVTAQKKAQLLTELQSQLRTTVINKNVCTKIKTTVNSHITNPEHANVYNKQRFFSYGQTATMSFLEHDLLARVLPP